MRTGRDNESVIPAFYIQKPYLKRAVFLDFSAHFINHCFCKLAPEGAQTVQCSDN